MNNHHLHFNKNYEITECAYCGYPSVSEFVTERNCTKNPERIQFNLVQKEVSRRIAEECVKSLEKKLDRLITDAAFKEVEQLHEAVKRSGLHEKREPEAYCLYCGGVGRLFGILTSECRCKKPD